MTLGISINGARVVVPGTYTQFQVEDSLANITPGGRNVLLIGEAAKGVPGSLLNLSGVFFTDYAALKAFYGSGPLVDAGRMLFSQQASPAFAGAVGRVYVYKTNASTRSTKDIKVGPTVYGAIVGAEYGLDGNLISAQIQAGSTEIRPTFSAYWLMRSEASDFKVRVSGGAELSVSAPAEALPSEIATTLSGLSGVSASGGALKEVLSAAQVTAADRLAVAVAGHEVTISVTTAAAAASTFQGAGIAGVAVGDILYIPAASAIAGAGSENVGSYAVTAASSSQIKARKLSSSVAGVEVAPVAPVAIAAGAGTTASGSQAAAASAELLVSGALTVSVSATTAVGAGASLEIYETAGGQKIAQRLWAPVSHLLPVSATSALVALVSVSVAASIGTFSISAGSFQALPKAGDVLWVKDDSVLAGAAKENVGAWIVQTAGSTQIVAKKVIAGGASVAASAASEDCFLIQAGLASTSIASKLNVSSQEKQVLLAASRQSDGLSFPATKAGGRIVLELSYSGTSATAEVTQSGFLKTSVVGGSGVNLNINLAQFATMGDLIALINSKTGYAAKVSNGQYNSLSPKSVLDKVAGIGICSGTSAPAYNGRIKADYFDFKKLIDSNFGLVAFKESAALVLKAGLPDVEAAAAFLAGGSIGATNDASIAAGFDAALKIKVEHVVPMFSRDASKDIEDGLTDENSSYSLDAVHASLKAHVLTASSSMYQKERFGLASFHGSFLASKEKAAVMANERVQMCFQMVRTTASDGTIKWFQPWMQACTIAAGRVQSNFGTSMLRKSFQISDIKHLGDVSMFSDALALDFDPDTKELDQAIEAGLVAMRAVTGFGIRMESPDLSTRSRDNDPKGWIYERVSVLLVTDVVQDTLRTALDNYIGNRTSDVSPSVIRSSMESILNSFIGSGALKKYSIDSIKAKGNTFEVAVAVFPTEALEFIVLNVTARRDIEG